MWTNGTLKALSKLTESFQPCLAACRVEPEQLQNWTETDIKVLLNIYLREGATSVYHICMLETLNNTYTVQITYTLVYLININIILINLLMTFLNFWQKIKQINVEKNPLITWNLTNNLKDQNIKCIYFSDNSLIWKFPN